MGEGNLVVFKGTMDGIVVILDEKAPFNEVVDQFKDKLKASKAFFKGSKVGIRFKGRVLSNDEQNEPIAYDERMLWVKNEMETMNSSLTHFHYGIIRSGMKIEYPGNVIVFGDINPGGEIKAGGNVIVFGFVKGKIHAGLDANFKRPFIISRGMTPIQVGLQNVIAPCPKDEKNISDELQVVYLVDEQIFIDVLDAKSINHMLSDNDKQGV